MSEYIKREAALNAIAKLCPDGKMYEHQNGYTALIDTYDAIDGINDIPTADVAPVVHGRWIEVHSIIAEQEGSHKRKCNICKTYTWNLGEPLRYCPNCGAKMDLEAHEIVTEAVEQ